MKVGPPDRLPNLDPHSCEVAGEIAVALAVPNSHASGSGPTWWARWFRRAGRTFAGTARVRTPASVFGTPSWSGWLIGADQARSIRMVPLSTSTSRR